MYREGSSAQAVARGLGWFSIGLGITELLAPGTLTKALGMEGNERLFRFYGAREIAAGIGILVSSDPIPWVWGRVAGDALDLATLAIRLNPQNRQKVNVAVSVAAVAGVTALDGICAQALSTAVSAPQRASVDYSDRRGMPKPSEQMRGAARNLQIPRDTRRPLEALRPFPDRAFAEQPTA